MAKPPFLVKLTHFANTDWPTVRLGHSVGAFDEKYPCANPEGPVDNSGCPDDDPLCECPCQELNPTDKSNLPDSQWYADALESFQEIPGVESIWQRLVGGAKVKEPTIDELKESAESIKECEYIQTALGAEYKGCIWKNQNHPSSCDCPCVGEKFKEYMEFTRTYATYWGTDDTTPIWREAQMALINSQVSVFVLNGDMTLRPGHLIYISAKQPGAESKAKKFSGRWLVSDISHQIHGMTHTMFVKLIRDSSPFDPNESVEESWWEKIGALLGF